MDLVLVREPVRDTVTVDDIVRVKGNVVAFGVIDLVRDTVTVDDIVRVKGNVVAFGVIDLVKDMVNEVVCVRVVDLVRLLV